MTTYKFQGPVRFVGGSSDDEDFKIKIVPKKKIATQVKQEMESKPFYSSNKKKSSSTKISNISETEDSLFEISSPIKKPKMDISHEYDNTENYSTILDNPKLNDSETTQESILAETQKQLVAELKKINDERRKTRDQLLLEYKRLKLDNQHKLSSKRESIEKVAITLEKNIGSLRIQQQTAETELKIAEEKLKSNESFRQMKELSTQIKKYNTEFSQSSETIKSLANILLYNPLTSSDFDLIRSTSTFQGDTGVRIQQLVSSLENCLIYK